MLHPNRSLALQLIKLMQANIEESKVVYWRRRLPLVKAWSLKAIANRGGLERGKYISRSSSMQYIARPIYKSSFALGEELMEEEIQCQGSGFEVFYYYYQFPIDIM